MITNNDEAKIVMYSFCGWPLTRALQLEIVPAFPSTLREYFGQILGHAHRLHQYGLVHLDIKPDNVMVNKETNDNNIVVTLVDFEFLLDEGSKIDGIRGSRGFWAPELDNIDQGVIINCKMDIYSVAKTFLHSAVQRFNHYATFDPKGDVSLSSWIENDHGGWCDHADKSVKCFLVEMLPPCLSPRPDERWTAAMAIEKLNEIWP